jgi:fructose-1,6-bisphosphatase
MLSGALLILTFIIFVSGVLSEEEENRMASNENSMDCEMIRQPIDGSKPMPDLKFIMSIPVSIL